MDERLCRELGANAYISKPHDSSALLEQIELLLGTTLPETPPPGEVSGPSESSQAL